MSGIITSILGALGISYGLLLGTLAASAVEPEQKDLIILVDQRNETVSDAGLFGAFTGLLISALAQEAAPLLVSTSLWQHYIDRKRDFEIQASLPHTLQYAYKNYYTDILKQLHSWDTIFSKQTTDMAERMQLLEVQLTKELFNPDIHKKLRDARLDLSPDAKDFLAEWYAVHSVKLLLDNWAVYKVNEYFCLFVPNSLLGLIRSPHSSTSVLTDLEKRMGLKVDHLPKIEYPENGFVYVPSHMRPEGIFQQALEKVLVTKKEDPAQNHVWNMVLGGHGLNAQFPGTQVHIIAGLSLEDFIQFLDFLNSHITTRLLIYKTCYGGGKHLYLPYQEQGSAKIYSYPIMVLALTDVLASVHSAIDSWNPCMEQSFNIGFFAYNAQNNTWDMRSVAGPIKWNKFFAAVHDKRAPTDVEWLTQNDIVEALSPRSPENLPHVRLAGSDHFVQYFEENVLYLTPAVCSLHEPGPLVAHYKDVILLETLHIPLRLCIPQDRMIFISTVPGDAVHYIHALEAPHMTFNAIIKGFWPREGATYCKEYFFDEVHCVADKTLLEILALQGAPEQIHIQEGDTVVLKDVILISEYAHHIRVLFMLDQHAYIGHARKTHENNIAIRMLWKMPEYQVQEYTDLFAAKTAQVQTVLA